MRAAYFETNSGIAGDMSVAALLDLGAERGLSLDRLQGALSFLGVPGYHLELEDVDISGVEAVRFLVKIDEPPTHDRDWSTIRKLIEDAGTRGLSEGAVARAIRIFTALAEAESRAHNVDIERVHFHEVGAIDSIVDIVAAAWCLDELGVEACFCGPLPSGSGYADTEHGRLPVPTPATVELLRGFEVVAGDGDGELVTPTGAAILNAMAKPLKPAMTLEGVGYGAGTMILPDRPNVLRVMLGEADPVNDDEVYCIEADIDDATPESLSFVADRLRDQNARDVSLLPLQMKKGRLGMRLSVLCDLGHLDSLAETILSETSTIGVRYRSAQRTVLPRRIETVDTDYGAIDVKIVTRPNGRETAEPEFDDIARAAREHGVSLKTAREAALTALPKS